MLLIYKDKKKRIIKGKEEIIFSSFSSHHLIVLTARAKSEKQISERATDDEELVVRIDDKTFPKLDNRSLLVDSPAAINGGRLHNLSKTVYFLTFLKGKHHKLLLSTDKPTNTATFENLEIYTLGSIDNLALEAKLQAEDGDRRPWVTFAADSSPLKEISVTLTYYRRKRDSDDVRVKIDNKIQGNLLKVIKHFLWYFVGSFLPWVSSTKTESQTFTTSLPAGLHYIELDADRMPILEKATLNFGQQLQVPEDIPTVNNPDWTGNFYDDMEEMLLARAIYGEGGGETEETKIAIGWAIRNRVEDAKSRWGNTYHEVILKPFQYEPFNNLSSRIFKKITQPPIDDLLEKQAWQNSYEAARLVSTGNGPDPIKGANHFYVPSPTNPIPDWADEEKFIVQIGKSRFYKL